jgi:hypothetical protein
MFWFNRMIHEMNLRPDTVSMNSIIEAHAKSGDKR